VGQSRTRKKKVRNRGRTALITGSTGPGMGRSTAFRLALENAETDAKRVADMIHDLGREALIIPADTRDPDQVRAMVDAGVETIWCY
jgi:NAD(P)-dependent dehydrogenase (short-subunit alcohol dehydrogenase family)